MVELGGARRWGERVVAMERRWSEGSMPDEACKTNLVSPIHAVDDVAKTMRELKLLQVSSPLRLFNRTQYPPSS